LVFALQKQYIKIIKNTSMKHRDPCKKQWFFAKFLNFFIFLAKFWKFWIQLRYK